MDRGSQYNRSQITLMRFAEIFNNAPGNRNILLEPIREETYNDDGCILDLTTKTVIGIDWEIRDAGFENGRFPWPTLGQWERKFKPGDGLKLSIQAARDEPAIAVAWHEDYKEEKTQAVAVATDMTIYANMPKPEQSIRYTSHFRVYRYDEILKFKEMLRRAITNRTFNHLAFNPPSPGYKKPYPEPSR